MEAQRESEGTQLCLTLATPWMVAHQALLSMEFSRQEYGSELPFLAPGVLPDPGIEPLSPAFQLDSLPLSHLESSPKTIHLFIYSIMGQPRMIINLYAKINSLIKNIWLSF